MAQSDELITRYTLQDNFSAKADHIRSKAKNAADAIERGQRVSKISWGQSVGGSSTGMTFGGLSSGGGGMFGDMFSGMADAAQGINPVSLAISSVIKPLKLFITTYLDVFQKLSMVTAGGVGLLGAFVGKAMEAANQFDSMERSFSAMLGSVEKGKQMMGWIRQYGLSSGFTQEAIVETTRSVVALGLDVEKYLPILEKFALFAGPDPQNLTEMAAIMRRLVGGQIAEAFGPEGLGRFGINRQMLSSFGAQFNKQGQFLGGVTEALTVLENVANNSPLLRDLKKAFDDSPAVKFSNAIDAIQIALIDAGRVFQTAFMPFIDRFSAWIQQLVSSGGVQRFASNIVNMFTKLIDKAGGFEGILNTIAAGLENMPLLLSGIGQMVIGMGKVIFSVIQTMLDWAVPKINAFIVGMNAILNAIGQQGLNTINLSDDGTLAAAMSDMSRAYYGFMAGRAGFGPSPGAGAGAQIGAAGFGGGVLSAPKGQGSNPIQTAMENIETNTKQTAINTEKLDLQRFVMGGGDLGRLGVTPVEVRRANRELKVRVDVGDTGTAFGDMIQSIVMRTLERLQKDYALVPKGL